MTNPSVSRSETRSVFGANLRVLSDTYPSVSDLCRQLQMNRTQFNRYLAGQNFPRPDVLDRICRFFEVDARILLQPLDEIARTQSHPAAEMLDQFLTPKTVEPPAIGFYHLCRLGADPENPVQSSVVHIRRAGHSILLRGYTPRRSSRAQSPQQREIQGMIVASESNLVILMSRRNAQDRRMIVLSKQNTGAGWSSTLSIMHDDPGTGLNQFSLRYLGASVSDALPIARQSRG